MFNFFRSPASTIDMQDAVAKVGSGAMLLVDVREAAEVHASGKAKGAINLPLSTLHQTADPKSGHFDKNLSQALKKGTPVCLYCASGARSGRAADHLRSIGFADVHNIGSLHSWASAGGLVVR